MNGGDFLEDDTFSFIYFSYNASFLGLEARKKAAVFILTLTSLASKLECA
jgi:hypothetical protein